MPRSPSPGRDRKRRHDERDSRDSKRARGEDREEGRDRRQVEDIREDRRDKERSDWRRRYQDHSHNTVAAAAALCFGRYLPSCCIIVPKTLHEFLICIQQHSCLHARFCCGLMSGLGAETVKTGGVSAAGPVQETDGIGMKLVVAGMDLSMLAHMHYVAADCTCSMPWWAIAASELCIQPIHHHHVLFQASVPAGHSVAAAAHICI